jgi:hypothetical protein
LTAKHFAARKKPRRKLKEILARIAIRGLICINILPLDFPHSDRTALDATHGARLIGSFITPQTGLDPWRCRFLPLKD